MLVLGIDPGIRAAGWGLVEEKNGGLGIIDCGVVRPNPSKEIAPRLKCLFTEFTLIVEKYKPDELAVENIFVAKSARSALILGQARAAAYLPGLVGELPLHEYTPLAVKKALVGNGQADKEQVAMMVCRLLGLKKTPKPADITDALAVAICHIHTAPAIRMGMVK